MAEEGVTVGGHLTLSAHPTHKTQHSSTCAHAIEPLHGRSRLAPSRHSRALEHTRRVSSQLDMCCAHRRSLVLDQLGEALAVVECRHAAEGGLIACAHS